MARRPQPLQIRRLHGNPSRRPMPPEPDELKPRQPLGPPPDFLSSDARAVWYRVSDSMPLGIVANCDLDLVASYCGAVALHELACKELNQTGPVIMGANNVPVTSPWLQLQIREALLILRLGAELGLSPTSRASLASKIASAAGTDFAFPGQRRSRPNALDEYLSRKPDRLPPVEGDDEPN
jgi:P27 family predicted phage terminase small subunit